MPTYLAPRGLRKTSNIITVGAAATAEVLYQITATGGGAVGRTCILRKIWIYTAVGNCIVQIGTGLLGAFAQIIPPLLAINTFANTWWEDEIPEVEVNADLTVISSVLGCLVQVEVEEIGT